MKRILYNSKFYMAVILFVLVISIWTVWQNLTVGITKYDITLKNLQKNADGMKIVHLSDIHNWDMGLSRKYILQEIESFIPDFIAISGDLVDSRHTDVKTALELVSELSDIAPIYFVTGNHEAFLSTVEWQDLKEGLESLGVHILRNDACTLPNFENIEIIGMDDPRWSLSKGERYYNKELSISSEDVNKLASDDKFTILLSHRPEYFEAYGKSKADIALCGHVHGGQIRLPFVGGLYGSTQGFFPRYDGGIYRSDDFVMVVSRGIGGSAFPFRFNNQPEVVFIRLNKEN